MLNYNSSDSLPTRKNFNGIFNPLKCDEKTHSNALKRL